MTAKSGWENAAVHQMKQIVALFYNSELKPMMTGSYIIPSMQFIINVRMQELNYGVALKTMCSF